MVRIYAILEDVGSEYEAVAPTQISLKPFDIDCYYLDLEENKECDEFKWKPFNCIVRTKGYLNIESNEFSEGYNRFINYLYGEMCQKYENGKPIEEPYFEEW